MRHIESSKKICISQSLDPATVKYSLVEHLRTAFHVETVGENVESFTITASSKTSSYVFNLSITLRTERERIRVMIDGCNDVSISNKILYVGSILLVLILSMFPEAIGGGNGNFAMAAMIFLVVGSFIIYDFNRKIDEPQILIDRILDSLEAEFG